VHDEDGGAMLPAEMCRGERKQEERKDDLESMFCSTRSELQMKLSTVLSASRVYFGWKMKVRAVYLALAAIDDH